MQTYILPVTTLQIDLKRKWKPIELTNIRPLFRAKVDLRFRHA